MRVHETLQVRSLGARQRDDVRVERLEENLGDSQTQASVMSDQPRSGWSDGRCMHFDAPVKSTVGLAAAMSSNYENVRSGRAGRGRRGRGRARLPQSLGRDPGASQICARPERVRGSATSPLPIQNLGPATLSSSSLPSLHRQQQKLFLKF